MAKSVNLTHIYLKFLRINLTKTSLFLSAPSRFNSIPKTLTLKPYSTTSTSYPLQYDMIISRPSQSQSQFAHQSRRLPPQIARSKSPDSRELEPDSELGFNEWVDKRLTASSKSNVSRELEPGTELGFNEWVDKKLTASGEVESKSSKPLGLDNSEMDKSKRKYYNKRRKRMYGGSDSDDEGHRNNEDGYVELKPEVVEFRTLHKREEELYFYDTFAYPWEKDKHYKMVYQLEKKYFPDQCFDKAFLEPGESKEIGKSLSKRKSKIGEKKENIGDGEENDKGLVFFEGSVKDDEKVDVTEKKVEEFFKCLKKVPDTKTEADSAEPYVAALSTGLPPKWDSATGTVVLVNKPKGWTSFTVCGKLRRLVNVKKVGHAGTLDPMATGLLIVCVGKATKVVDRYQGMIKGYSGIFRLGEATSTLDADSPVIQRELWEHVKDDDIKKAAESFCGDIWQVPPMFSAIKVGGEKMYDKARRGESIELSPRRISILQFDVERSLNDRQNVIFRVTCSKGTYIRSLCADFGKALGSCAHLTALRRDSIGQYKADDAWEFKELEEAITKDYL